MTRSLPSLLLRGLVVLLVLEGVLSTVAVGRAVARLLSEAPRLYTRYDPELGWAATPGLALEDLWGPGASLHTNSRGFRGRREVAADAAGRRRIICSGDSFTLGVGVGDDDTWCAWLEALGPQLETVNMGQGGYGVDQAFLWFRRDGAALQQRLHLFAFIAPDLERMAASEFVGFGKPVLALEGGRLVTRNVPVPRRPYLFPWLTLLSPQIRELRSVGLLGGMLSRVAPRPRPLALADPWPVFFAICEELRALNARAGSELVLLYLPTAAEAAPGPGLDAWRSRLRVDLERRGFEFLDLVPDLRALPPEQRERLFLPATVLGRHYSVEGNRFVAERIWQRISSRF